MQLTIVRKFQLMACLCRTKITVVTEMEKEVARLTLWTGQTKTLSLPEQRYILKASTAAILARPTVNTAICYGDRFNQIHVAVEVVNFNFLACWVPGVGLTVPLFEYKLTLRNEAITDEN